MVNPYPNGLGARFMPRCNDEQFKLGHYPFIVLRTLARLRADALNLVDAFADSLLYPLIGGLVISTVAQIVREALHVSHFICEIVSVLIALTITQALH